MEPKEISILPLELEPCALPAEQAALEECDGHPLASELLGELLRLVSGAAVEDGSARQHLQLRQAPADLLDRHAHGARQMCAREYGGFAGVDGNDLPALEQLDELRRTQRPRGTWQERLDHLAELS